MRLWLLIVLVFCSGARAAVLTNTMEGANGMLTPVSASASSIGNLGTWTVDPDPLTELWITNIQSFKWAEDNGTSCWCNNMSSDHNHALLTFSSSQDNVSFGFQCYLEGGDAFGYYDLFGVIGGGDYCILSYRNQSGADPFVELHTASGVSATWIPTTNTWYWVTGKRVKATKRCDLSFYSEPGLVLQFTTNLDMVSSVAATEVRVGRHDSHAQYGTLNVYFDTLLLDVGASPTFPLFPTSNAPPIIPPERRIDWSSAGVTVPSSGWPIWTNALAAGATGNGTTDDSAALQAAIRACPSGQVVYLPPGQYKLATGLVVTNSIVLRGAGISNTVIKSACANPTIQFIPPGYGSRTSANLTNGMTQGSTNLVVDSSMTNAAFKVGSTLFIDQTNDSVFVLEYGNEGLCNWCGRTNGSRAMGQIATITAISGSNVTVDTPMFWTYTNAPQGYWYARPNLPYCGLEDLCVNGAGIVSGDNTVDFYLCQNSWARNVQMMYGNRAQIRLYMCSHCVVRDSYVVHAASFGITSYGIELDMDCLCLVENNRFNDLSAGPVMAWVSSGNVIGYNYLTNFYVSPNWNPESLQTHDAHCFMNLYEGNYTPMFYFDFIHGSSSHQTVFRNRSVGWQTAMTENTYAVVIEATNTFLNVVGNVLGKSGYHTDYEITGVNSGETYKHIYKLGYWTTGLNTHFEFYDPNVTNTLLRHMNYDTVTATNSGVVWNTNANRTLPDSLYLASKPAFFGSTTWPWVDPLSPANSLDPTNLPAGWRLHYGTESNIFSRSLNAVTVHAGTMTQPTP